MMTHVKCINLDLQCLSRVYVIIMMDTFLLVELQQSNYYKQAEVITIYCLGKINKTQIDNAKDIDVVMLMYNLIQYSDNYSKTPESLW